MQQPFALTQPSFCHLPRPSEADKQEEALENAEQDLGGEDGLSMRNSAIVTINAQVGTHVDGQVHFVEGQKRDQS